MEPVGIPWSCSPPPQTLQCMAMSVTFQSFTRKKPALDCSVKCIQLRWVKVLHPNVHKIQIISEMLFPANLLASIEKTTAYKVYRYSWTFLVFESQITWHNKQNKFLKQWTIQIHTKIWQGNYSKNGKRREMEFKSTNFYGLQPGSDLNHN